MSLGDCAFLDRRSIAGFELVGAAGFGGHLVGVEFLVEGNTCNSKSTSGLCEGEYII
jgi:hypothetical protein